MFTSLLVLMSSLAAFVVFRRVFPKKLTQDEAKERMQAFFEKRMPSGFPISREEIIQNVFDGRNVPLLVKNDGHLVYLRTAVSENGWTALAFVDGKLPHWDTPEEIDKKLAAFQNRELVETPQIRVKLLEETFGGVGVTEVGDLCWLQNIDHSYVLATATLNNGKHVVVGYEDGTFSLLSSERGNFQMVLDNLQRRPPLEFDDDGYIDIRFAKGRQLLVSFQSLDGYKRKRGWYVHDMFEEFGCL